MFFLKKVLYKDIICNYCKLNISCRKATWRHYQCFYKFCILGICTHHFK